MKSIIEISPTSLTIHEMPDDVYVVVSNALDIARGFRHRTGMAFVLSNLPEWIKSNIVSRELPNAPKSLRGKTANYLIIDEVYQP